jgi:hypothetical protein
MSNTGSSLQQPIQAVAEYTDEEYKKNLLFLANQYNNASNNIPVITAAGATASAGTTSYISEYFQNLTYIYGTQTPAAYSFFVKDLNGNATQTPMLRGLDVFKIFNYLHGQATDLIDPLPKTTLATAYSKNAVSAKKDMLDYVYFQIKSKVFLNLIQQESGYGFQAIDRDFKTQDEVDKFFENAQEGMEVAYNNMAKDALYVNDYQILLPKSFDYTLVGNLAVICVDYENGRPKWRIVTPDKAIVDYSKGLDVHLDDSYAGEVFQMEIPDLFTTWEFSEKEQKELEAIANNEGGLYGTYFSTYMNNGLYWWTNTNNTPKVTCVKGQWKSLEKQSDGTYKKVNREGVLIGEKYLRGCMISPGQIGNKKKNGEKRLKYIVLTPNLMLGTSISIVGIIKRYQDLKDAYLTKMTNLVASSSGRAVVIRASKLPVGMNTPDVISQLKQARVIVIEGADTDEETDNRNLAETVDLTLDPSVGQILAMAQYFDGIISDVLNIPPTVRGQQSGYQSAKVVDNTQTQSSKGLAYLFKNFMLWVKEVLEYSVDLYKVMAPDDELGREHLQLLVGDAMVDLLSMDTVKEMQFEDFLLALNPTDYVGEAEKAKLSELALSVATSGASRQILKDYLKLDSLDSKTEQINYLEAEIYKDEQREAAQMQAEREAKMAQAELAANAQQQLGQLQSDTTLENTAMNNMAKMAADQNKQAPRYS